MTHEPPTGWDASAHPGLERLAELEEGLLDADDRARVAEHVAGCAQCHEQQALLTRTGALLRALPAEAMPAEVAARLDAALADAGAATSTTSPAGDIVPLGGARRRWRLLPAAAGLGAAAAVAAVVAVLVVGHNSGGGSSTPEQTTALGQAQTDTVLTDLTTTTSGTNYTSHNLAAAVPQLLSGPVTAMTEAAPASPGGASTGAAPNTRAGAAAPPSAIPSALARLHNSPSALRSCVLGVEAGGKVVRPLAIDFAHYQGAPAVLVVLPGLTTGFVDAWFVGPACDDQDAHLLGYKAIPSSGSPSPGG